MGTTAKGSVKKVFISEFISSYCIINNCMTSFKSAHILPCFEFYLPDKNQNIHKLINIILYNSTVQYYVAVIK